MNNRDQWGVLRQFSVEMCLSLHTFLSDVSWKVAQVTRAPSMPSESWCKLSWWSRKAEGPYTLDIYRTPSLRWRKREGWPTALGSQKEVVKGLGRSVVGSAKCWCHWSSLRVTVKGFPWHLSPAFPIVEAQNAYHTTLWTMLYGK